MTTTHRPLVILNAAMTVDGRITTKGNDTNLSNEEDWQRVHVLRNEVDAIMVGRNTVIKDDPKLTVKAHLLPPETPIRHPTRVIITSSLDIPLTAKVFCHKIDEVPTIVATTSQASDDVIKILSTKGIEVLICETRDKKVNLPQLMRLLWEKGIKSVLLEGGGHLNWHMLKEGLIDEIIVQIASKISGGGTGAISLFQGEGFETLDESPQLKLIEVKKIGENVLLHYKVLHA